VTPAEKDGKKVYTITDEGRNTSVMKKSILTTLKGA